MLKLMKYEFIHSYRTFLISFVAFIVGCVMLPFFMDGFLSQVPVLSIVFAIGFSFLLIAILLALFISIFINYDRSMFKRPGYLTLTLPVSTPELILSKVLTSIVWLIISMLVLFVGCLLMVLVMTIKEHTFEFSSFMSEFYRFGVSFMEYLTQEPLNFFGNLIFGLGNLLLLVSGIYFSMTIVHTKWFRRHQIVLGIVFYIVLNLIIGWISTVLFGDRYMLGMGIGEEAQIIWIHGLYYLVIGALLTIGTIYTIDHHIEIE